VSVVQNTATKTNIAVACCTTQQQQVSSEVAAILLHHRGLAIAGSWQQGLHSSRMQSTPVDTVLQRTQEPSAEITTNDWIQSTENDKLKTT